MQITINVADERPATAQIVGADGETTHLTELGGAAYDGGAADDAEEITEAVVPTSPAEMAGDALDGGAAPATEEEAEGLATTQAETQREAPELPEPSRSSEAGDAHDAGEAPTVYDAVPPAAQESPGLKIVE